MFSFLEELHHNLYERYLTLERNIKARSNSFYDAYLDLLECFVKHLMLNEGYVCGSNETCGALLRKDEVRRYFTERLSLDEYMYEKLQDYILKINAHKHKNEKNVQLETVIRYLRVFHSAVNAYARNQGITLPDFDESYYTAIFGVFEKENEELRSELQTLRDELETAMSEGKLKDSDIALYQSILSQAELDKLTLEEQNAALLKEIGRLKDIKLASLEDKLNRAIDMLLSLQQSIVETRAVAYAVGDTICGRELFQDYVERAQKELGCEQ